MKDINVRGGGSNSVVLIGCHVSGTVFAEKKSGDGQQPVRILAEGTVVAKLVSSGDTIVQSQGSGSFGSITSSDSSLTVQGDTQVADLSMTNGSLQVKGTSSIRSLTALSDQGRSVVISGEAGATIMSATASGTLDMAGSLGLDKLVVQGGNVTVSEHAKVASLLLSGAVDLNLANGAVSEIAVSDGTSITDSSEDKTVANVPIVSQEGSQGANVTVDGAPQHVHVLVVTSPEVPATCIVDGVTAVLSCSDPDCPEHYSVGGEVIRAPGHDTGAAIPEVPATCTDPGVMEHMDCSVCHALLIYVDEQDFHGFRELSDAELVIAPLGHDLAHIDEVKPTCTEYGVNGHYQCDRCHNTFSDAAGQVPVSQNLLSVEPLGHKMVRHDPVLATCTGAGSVLHFICSVCEHVFTDEAGTSETTLEQCVIPSVGHQFGNPFPEVPATCTVPGMAAHLRCSVCERLFILQENDLVEVTAEDLRIEAPGHHIVHIDAVAPTCTGAGNVEHYFCDRCQGSFSDALGTVPVSIDDVLLEPLGHEWVFVAVPVDGGCTVIATCSNDHEHDIAEPIYAQGSPKEGTGPTCYSPGAQTWILFFGIEGQAFNGIEVDTAELPALGHDWDVRFLWSNDLSSATYEAICRNQPLHYAEGDAVITDTSTQPTCTESGVIGKTATATIPHDGTIITDSRGQVTGPLGHQWDETVYTWTEVDGQHFCSASHRCTREGCNFLEAQEVMATSRVTVAPLCETAGTTLLTAEFILFPDTTKTVEIPALGHLPRDVPAQAATCTEAGWNAHHVCDRCMYTDRVDIKPLGHDMSVHVEARAPTLTEPGWAAYDQCSRCNHNTKVEIEPLEAFTVTVFGGTADAEGVPAAQSIRVAEGTVVTIRAVPVYGRTFHHWGLHDGHLAPVHADDPGCTLMILVNQDTYVTAHYTDDFTYDPSKAVVHKAAEDCTDTTVYSITSDESPDFKVFYVVYGTEHEFAEKPVIETAPTCTTPGSGYYECVGCGYRSHFEIPAIGHDFTSSVVTTEAHGSVVGVRTYTCAECGATEERPYISAVLPSGDLRLSLEVMDIYYGDSSTLTRDEIHYTFQVPDAQGHDRQAYLYYVYKHDSAHFDGMYRTWFLWIDDGAHSPIYICRNEIDQIHWAYDESRYLDGGYNKWGIVGYADTLAEVQSFVDTLNIGAAGDENASQLLDTFHQWERAFNSYGPDYFLQKNVFSYLGQECRTYWDAHEEYYYVVNADNCCLQYGTVNTYRGWYYRVTAWEEIDSFEGLATLTGYPLDPVPTKDIIHYYYLEVINGVNLSEDRLGIGATIKQMFDVDDLRGTTRLLAENPAHRSLAGWQVLDLDGRWVPITTKVCHDSVRPYYIFNDDVYGGSSAIHLFRYLSQHPEFGRFAEVSSPEFSDFKIRAVYALNASVGFTAVNGEFYDDDAGDWVSSGIAFQNEEVDVYAREIPGMRFDHWTVTIGGTQVERFPTGPESDRAVSDITWGAITIYIRDHEDVVVTAHYVESGEEDASDTYNVVITSTAGGTIIGSASGTYHEDDMIEVLAVPSYGYIFIGWYCGNPDYPDWGYLYEEYPGVTYWIYRDVKFTAVFERIDVSDMYTVFVENGYVHGSDSDLCMSAIYRYGGDRVYLIPDPFADPLHKWVITELDEDGVPAGTRIEHVDPDDVSYIHYEDCDVSVVGVFESEVDSRTVTFASNGGSGTMSDLIVCEDSGRLTLPANGFTRENYDFLGWSTDPEAVEATYRAGATIDLGSDDIRLYAVWKAASHNLSFSVANGIYGYGYYYDWVNGTNIPVTFGQENTVPAVDQLLRYHRGFDIIGWTDPEGNTYAADGTAIVPYSVYRLTAVVQFWTVTVHFESSSPAGEMPDAQLTFNGSSNGYLPDDHVLFNRTGYSFAGWYLDDSSSSNVGSSLNRIDMDKLFQKSGVTNGGEVTLHASWSVKYYNLYYEYNLDGIYGYYPSSAALINGGHRLHTIPASTPLPEGVTFVEWNTRQDGSGNGYSANELINTAFIAREFTGNDSVLHLYAIWTGPLVKYNLDGGDGKLPDCKSYRSSELVSGYTLLLQEPYNYVFQLPTKGDLRLAGWSLTRGGEIYDGNDRISGVELADDGSLTLYAVYAPVSQNA